MLRKVDIVVISDVHLGTYGCHATELLHYLKSVNPSILILNGDIIDAWQFKRRFFPPDHIEVLREILRKSLNETTVYYLTGNHDDILRQFSDFAMGQLYLVDKLDIMIDGKRHWFFHGDVFDSSLQLSPLLAKLGGKGYDMLIRINRVINKARARFNMPPRSFSKRVKSSVKKAVSFINDFEDIAIRLAIDEKYDVVACGHIHHAQHRTVETQKGNVIYLNSGDWVESLTALEYYNQSWSIYHHDQLPKAHNISSINYNVFSDST